MLRMAVGIAILSATLCDCSQSDLDRCIDTQMAVWKQKQQSYEEQVRNYKPPYDAGNEMVNVGGLELDKNLLAYPQSPGTKAEAEARANLACGRIYAKGN